MNFLIAFIIAIVIALIVVCSLVKDMNNIHQSKVTSSYISENSFRVTGSRDDYLYRTVSKTRINNNSNNSSSGANRGRSGGHHGGHRGGPRRHR